MNSYNNIVHETILINQNGLLFYFHFFVTYQESIFNGRGECAGSRETFQLLLLCSNLIVQPRLGYFEVSV